VDSLRRLTIEKDGLFVQSTTQIENSMLTKDDITAISVGCIKVAIVDDEWDGILYKADVQIQSDHALAQKEMTKIANSRPLLDSLRKTIQAYSAASVDLAKAKREMATNQAETDSISMARRNKNATRSAMKAYSASYKYQASEADSKRSSFIIASREVKNKLLNELGTYLFSFSEVQNHQLTIDNIASLANGVVDYKVTREIWNGKEFFIEATMVVDTLALPSSIVETSKDTAATLLMTQMHKQTQSTLQELASIKYLMNKSPTSEYSTETMLAQNRYLAKVKLITAEDYLNSAINEMGNTAYWQAVYLLSRAIDLGMSDIRVYSLRAQTFRKLLDYHRAVKDYSTILLKDPKCVWAYKGRAECLEELQNWDKAIADYTMYISIDPERFECYFSRAMLYDFRIQDFQKAYSDYSKVISLEPRFPEAYTLRGELLYNRYDDIFHNKEKQQAIADIQNGCRLGSAFARKWLHDHNIPADLK
jgi:tetratricopeptide (TPR) repeat protein